MSAIIEDRIPYWCGLDFAARHSLDEKSRTVVILSSGYGPSSFDRPLRQQIIQSLSKNRINWLQYVYPERDPKNPLDDLTISSGSSTVVHIARWLSIKGYRRIALCGNSFGANISIEAALYGICEYAILTNPVVDFYEYRKRQVGSDGIQRWNEVGIEKLCYERGQVSAHYRFMREAKAQAQSLIVRSGELDVPVLAMQGGRDKTMPPQDIFKLRFKNPNSRVRLLEEGEHTIRDRQSLDDVGMELDRFLRDVEG